MVRDGMAGLKSDPATLRRFGRLMGGILAGAGLLLALRPHAAFPWLVGGGVALWILGTVAPRRLRPIQRAWMWLGLILGTAMSTLLLIVIFYLVVVPLGLAARLAGRDFLRSKRDPNARTYWLERAPGVRQRPADYERQF